MIVIAAVTLAIGIATSLTSVNELNASFAAKKGDGALFLVESCVEDALLSLNEKGILPAEVSLPQGVCSLILDSQSGQNFVFTAQGSFSGHSQSIQVSATRNSSVVIDRWIDVN